MSDRVLIWLLGGGLMLAIVSAFIVIVALGRAVHVLAGGGL